MFCAVVALTSILQQENMKTKFQNDGVLWKKDNLNMDQLMQFF
jgi:hypothetical protein